MVYAIQEGIEDGVGVEDFQAKMGDVEWLQPGGERAQIDEIFLGGYEALRVLCLGGEIADVSDGIGVVIAESNFTGEFDTIGAKIVEEALGTSNGAEGQKRAGGILEVNRTT